MGVSSSLSINVGLASDLSLSFYDSLGSFPIVPYCLHFYLINWLNRASKDVQSFGYYL